MIPTRPVTVLSFCFAAVAAASFGMSVRAHAAQAGAGKPAETVFVLPARRAADARPMAPPDLPAAAASVPPLTLDIAIQRTSPDGSRSTIRQTCSRTADRIHMRSGAREWFFARNVVDVRRVSALLVDHARRTIVHYEESDVRNLLGLTGWADLLAMGADVAGLSRLTPTGRVRVTSGVSFRQYSAPNDDRGLPEIWWNEALVLPGAMVLRDATGVTRFSVERVRQGVDATLLDAPAARFPGYKAIDVAEWLEGR
jgi:hypothetical protein